MKTTLREILSHNPCGQEIGSGIGWDLLTKTLGTSDLNTEVDLIDIMKSNGIRDAIWALRTQKYLDCCLFLADIAELSLPVFEAYRPDDSRVKDCIQAVRDYKAGMITYAKLKFAADSVWAGSFAADAWAAGATKPVWAAEAAAEAAWTAKAAEAAANAARFTRAAVEAVYAAEAAGVNRFEIEDLFVEHFGGFT